MEASMAATGWLRIDSDDDRDRGRRSSRARAGRDTVGQTEGWELKLLVAEMLAAGFHVELQSREKKGDARAGIKGAFCWPCYVALSASPLWLGWVVVSGWRTGRDVLSDRAS